MYKNKQDEDKLRQRIIMLMRDKVLTQKKLAKDAGFQATNLSLVINGSRDVPESLIKGILDAYPDVDSMWLVHGVGNMYSKDNGEGIAEVKTKPRLPVTAAAGRLTTYVEGVMRYQCEELPVIRNFPDYDFTMVIKGNSMEPKYEGGDEIALKKATIIEWGKDYVLDTEDGAIFKKIYEDGENIRCVSYNHDEYPDFLVPKDLIFGYYRFVGLIRL